jgi:putative acetyltransferase
MTAHIDIRAERDGDEEAIDAVVCSAFGSMDEANLVRNMRSYYPAFDRRLSLIAWDGDEAVGHTLLTPARIRLLGQTVNALAVAPVAVVPERQRQGIGGKMLRFGHELGRREGFALAFLCGIPAYYPRFGYVACFGGCKVTLDEQKLPAAQRTFRTLPVRPEDMPWLVERFAAEWADVDFAWLWGSALSEWATPCIDTKLWWRDDGRRAAYTVADRMILADDADLARDVLAAWKPKRLAHHPAGWLARHVLDDAWATVEATRGDYAMACELQDGVLAPLLEALESGRRPPGATPWPLPVLACL